MRHRKHVHKLGRTASHRKATLKNIATELLKHHKIRTTLAKAKAARGYIERLITYGKDDTVHSRRLAFKFLQNRDLVKILFDEIAPAYSDRNGGYTRVIKLGRRRGDAAKLGLLQLVGFEDVVIDEQPKKKKKSKARPEDSTKAAAEKSTMKEGKEKAETKATEEASVEEKTVSSERSDTSAAAEKVDTKTTAAKTTEKKTAAKTTQKTAPAPKAKKKEDTTDTGKSPKKTSEDKSK